MPRMSSATATILDFDATSVTSIALSALNQPELALQRLESPRRRPRGGLADHPARRRAQASQTLAGGHRRGPAPPRAARDAERRSSSRATPRTNADIEDWGFNRPEREITLTLARDAGDPGDAPDRPSDEARERRLCADRGPALRLRRRARHPARDTSASPLAWRERLLEHAARLGADHVAHPHQRLRQHGRLRAQAVRRRDLGRARSPPRPRRSKGRRQDAPRPAAHAAGGELRPGRLPGQGASPRARCARGSTGWTPPSPSPAAGRRQVNTMTLWFAERTGGDRAARRLEGIRGGLRDRAAAAGRPLRR